MLYKRNLRFGLLLFCVITSIFFIGSDCGNVGGGNQNVSVTQVIGPEGGMITAGDNLLTLIIPPGALTEETEITVTRFRELEEEGIDLLFYEFLPDGLEFQIPAIVSVNVKDLTGFMEGDDDLIFPNLPLILSTEGDELLILDMPTLDIDFDTGEVVLTANVDHFTGIVVGGISDFKVSVNGVPFMATANKPFGPVKVFVINKSIPNIDLESDLAISYKDISQAPVLYQEGSNPSPLVPVPPGGETRIYDIKYACGNPGLGKLVIEIFGSVSQLFLKDVYSPSAVNAFSSFFGLIPKETEFSSFSYNYIISGSRDIECTGMMDDGDGDMPPATPTPTPTPTPSVTPPPTTEVCPIEGIYKTTSSGCALGMFTLSKTLASGNLLINPLGSGNPGTHTFEDPDMDDKYESFNKDLTIFGQGGHTCTLECVTGNENRVKVSCFNQQGGMCMETLERQTN